VYGHELLLDRLAGTIAASRFPQTVVFTGPAGVGRQRLALWVAQAMLCDRGEGTPCGSCRPCADVLNLRHPDLHWFVPIPRPKAAEPEKQIQEAEELLGEVMAERRRNGVWGPQDGMASHALASVRLLHRRVALTPFSGQRKVVILGDAERLVVQEASQEAANALLKVLEEPPEDTTLILTATEAHALLPTIRSRLVPVRVPRVSDAVVRRFLQSEVDPPLSGPALERRTVLAEGRIGRALESDAGDAGPDRAAERMLDAVRHGPEAWVAQALGQTPWSARGEFTAMLDAMAVRLRSVLERDAADGRPTLRRRLRALRALEEARASAQENINPQLLTAVLAERLEGLV
jgi:DNA polymerase-3 subunit delta'